MKITYKEYLPIDKYKMLERERVIVCAGTFKSGGLTYCRDYSGYICGVIDTDKIINITR